MKNIKLSILDLARFTKSETTAHEVLKHSAEIAVLADDLGFERYWFAEHHNNKSLVSMFPEIMISHIGSLTKRIRIGSGGVMLNNHSSLSVAERFAMLEALYPGRVDLGLGRAPGTDGRTALALRRNWDLVKSDMFAEQLEELIGYFGHDLRSDHPFSSIYASPSPTLTPEIYMLGSSTGGVQFALKHGLPFAFAAQLNAPLAVDVLRYYKENFQPSKFLSVPKSILCIVVITAKTDEEAWKIAEPSILYWVLFMTGKIKFNSSVQIESENYKFTPQELKVRDEVLQKFIIGSQETVEKQIKDWVSATEVDEIMVFDMYPDQDSRKEGYKLLAEKFI